jgi:lysophospholipase L1-like esterase
METQTSLAVKESVDYLILELGTNDNNTGDMGALQTILETQIARLQASNPRAKIYYLNIFPCWTDTSGTTPIDKSNIRTMIETVCENTGIICVDVSTWLIASNTSDGLHPNNTGSLLIAQKLIELLGI